LGAGAKFLARLRRDGRHHRPVQCADSARRNNCAVAVVRSRQENASGPSHASLLNASPLKVLKASKLAPRSPEPRRHPPRTVMAPPRLLPMSVRRRHHPFRVGRWWRIGGRQKLAREGAPAVVGFQKCGVWYSEPDDHRGREDKFQPQPQACSNASGSRGCSQHSASLPPPRTV
jgi:hypothetical protein